MRPRSAAVLLLAAGAAATVPVDTAELMHFSVSQVRQLDVGTPVVRAYLDVTDSEGRPFETLPSSSLVATLGEWPTETVSVSPFWAMEQGIAYVFLVDISKSLSPELFQQMTGGIETWIRGMGAFDRAALIAFGESSRLIVDFTADKPAILAGLASLGPTDDETLLHQALVDALGLSRRLDPDLPGRRALVIFSDGKDEGSAFESDDILDKLRDNPAPIYAIGYSRLRDPEEHRRYLNLLQRIASNSGGAFFAAEQTQFAQAYEAIRETIQRVWVGDFRCDDCRSDGSLHRLQVQVTIDEHVLSSGGSVRLLPLVKAPPPMPAEPAIQDPSREQIPPVPTPRGTDLSFDPGPWLLGLSVAALILILWAVLSAARRKRRAASRLQADAETTPLPIDPTSEPSVLDPPMPVPMPKRRPYKPLPALPKRQATDLLGPPKQVRLIVVRGSRKGRQYSFVVRDRAVVGRRSSCDCVLAEETGIDALQFELIHDKGELLIENLSDRMPTLITGHPLTGRLRLTSDTLIGTGESVLRIVFH